VTRACRGFSRSIAVAVALVGVSALGLSCHSQDKTCGSTPGAWPASLPPGTRIPLRTGWFLRSSTGLAERPEVLSSASFSPSGWYPARVPSTVVGTLVEDGALPDPYFGENLLSFPGMDYQVGQIFQGNNGDLLGFDMSQDSPFRPSWWYWTRFDLPQELAGSKIWLNLDGVNYRANVWLNGQRIGSSDQIVGTYAGFELDASCVAIAGGSNTLAIEVFAPEIRDLAHTWVDWNPMPPDKNMGLWREVWVTASGSVAIRDPQVVTRVDLPSLDVAHLTVSADLRNGSNQSVTGTLVGDIGALHFAKEVTIRPYGTEHVTFAAPGYPQLDVAHPSLWWPAQYGPQNLQTLRLEFRTPAGLSDTATQRFGIRQVDSVLDANGHRLFSINGKPIMIRGGGWARDMMFMETAAREDREMSLVRDLGLNTIRFEGKFGSDHLLDLADELGILVMPGWCCCDNWERGEWGSEQPTVAERSMRSMALRYRNRPSVFVWLYGSDGAPTPEAEQIYLRVLRESNWPNPALSSANSSNTPAGATGVKMQGPYRWVPPVYWYQDRNFGGAFGFATEISPGAAVPEEESLRAMLGDDHLWPIDPATTAGAANRDWWNYHAGEGGFTEIDSFTTALQARYGRATSLADYLRKAQAMTYEAERVMFEAYSGRKYTSTGVIQWMLNNAWPSILWHLYGHDLAAGGGYYGAKKALEPLHVQLDHGRRVSVVNSTLDAKAGLSVRAQVLGLDMQEFYAVEVATEVGADGTTDALVLPDLTGLPSTYLVHVEMHDSSGVLLSTNLYWLSTTPDLLDWPGVGFFFIPMLGYADLTALESLQSVQLQASASATLRGSEQEVSVEVTNPSASLAFMVRLAVTRGAGGKEILPTRWTDNYVSLLPGETRTLSARYLTEDGGEASPSLSVHGWNVQAQEVAVH